MMLPNPLLDMLAAGDFRVLTERFATAGFSVSVLGPGLIQILSPSSKFERPRLLLSVGIHGNETAPIDMMANILTEFMRTPKRLMVDLLIVVGNIAAIAQSRRFIEIDMNRLFNPKTQDQSRSAESDRADDIMAVTEQFFGADRNAFPKNNGSKKNWHLDLHSTIRPSVYTRFAIMPVQTAEMYCDEKSGLFAAWLGFAGIEAIVCNSLTAATYSAFSSRLPGVTSATLELGQVSTLGSNSLDPLQVTRDALANLMGGVPPVTCHSLPICFSVAQEILKVTEFFDLRSDRATENFTEIAPNTVIAIDCMKIYSTGGRAEYLLFPNPDVQIGQRAALMLYREGVEENRDILTSP